MRSHGPDGLYCKQHAKKHNLEIIATELRTKS